MPYVVKIQNLIDDCAKIEHEFASGSCENIQQELCALLMQWRELAPKVSLEFAKEFSKLCDTSKALKANFNVVYPKKNTQTQASANTHLNHPSSVTVASERAFSLLEQEKQNTYSVIEEGLGESQKFEDTASSFISTYEINTTALTPSQLEDLFQVTKMIDVSAEAQSHDLIMFTSKMKEMEQNLEYHSPVISQELFDIDPVVGGEILAIHEKILLACEHCVSYCSDLLNECDYYREFTLKTQKDILARLSVYWSAHNPNYEQLKRYQKYVNDKEAGTLAQQSRASVVVKKKPKTLGISQLYKQSLSSGIKPQSSKNKPESYEIDDFSIADNWQSTPASNQDASLSSQENSIISNIKKRIKKIFN